MEEDAEVVLEEREEFEAAVEEHADEIFVVVVWLRFQSPSSACTANATACAKLVDTSFGFETRFCRSWM